MSKWSLISGENEDCLRRIELKIVRGNYVVRHYIFNSFIIDYTENFDNKKTKFTMMLRLYKLISLDGKKGETGATKTESYIQNITINGKNGYMIIEPQVEKFDVGKNVVSSTLSGTNALTAYSILKGLTATPAAPIAIKIILIGYGVGMLSEFGADVYFVAKGEPEKMGSFNISRDWFYKPLGEVLVASIEKENQKIKLDDNIGEDFYNIGGLVYSILELGRAGMQHVKKLANKGSSLYFSFKVKYTQHSKYGVTINVVENKGTPIKDFMKKLAKELGFDTYVAGKTLDNELKKKQKREVNE